MLVGNSHLRLEMGEMQLSLFLSPSDVHRSVTISVVSEL